MVVLIFLKHVCWMFCSSYHIEMLGKTFYTRNCFFLFALEKKNLHKAYYPHIFSQQHRAENSVSVVVYGYMASLANLSCTIYTKIIERNVRICLLLISNFPMHKELSYRKLNEIWLWWETVTHLTFFKARDTIVPLYHENL